MRFTRGVVRAINPCRGMVAIWVDERSGYTIIEMLSSHDIDVGDELSWCTDTTRGRNSYRNETRGWVAEVCVHNHGVPNSKLRDRLQMAQSLGSNAEKLGGVSYNW